MKTKMIKMKRALRAYAYKHAPKHIKEQRAEKVAKELSKLFNNCPYSYVKNQPN